MCGILFRLSARSDAAKADRLKQIASRGPSGQTELNFELDYGRKRHLSVLHAVLNIRNSSIPQPVRISDDVVLAFNGELYVEEADDTEILLRHFRSFPDPLDAFKTLDRFPGPWAIVLVDLARRRVLFGRDALGRRSLVIENSEEEISIASLADSRAGEEVPPGVHSLCLETGEFSMNVHKYRTVYEQPEFFAPDHMLSLEASTESLHEALKISVHRQLACKSENVGVAILFSGGIDSTVIACLVGESEICENSQIDLINVSFVRDSPDRRTALVSYADLQKKFPGRFRLLLVDVSEAELDAATPEILAHVRPKDTHMDFNIGASLFFAGRGIGNLFSPEFISDPEWSLLREEVTESESVTEANSIRKKQEISDAVVCSNCGSRQSKAGCESQWCRLCCVKLRKFPCRVHKSRLNAEQPPTATEQVHAVDFDQFVRRYISDRRTETGARILLVGHGADELLGGYGRYKTREIFGSAEARRQEMISDLQRFWTRNLGRDDRCLSAHGRETRHPFWDERVHGVAGRLPSTEENKGVLREIVRKFYGNFACSDFRKRAIQFGTRIAQQSNVRCFGSHRQGSGTKQFSI